MVRPVHPANALLPMLTSLPPIDISPVRPVHPANVSAEIAVMLERKETSLSAIQFLNAFALIPNVSALPPLNTRVVSAEQFSNILWENPPMKQSNATVVRAEQSLNIDSLRTVTYAGMVMFSIAEPAKKDSPMLPALAGNVTDLREAQLANTPEAVRFVISSGITALTMPVLANILFLNAVIPGITMILSREVQPSNKEVPNVIASFLSSKVTSVREVQPLNTLLPIVLT